MRKTIAILGTLLIAALIIISGSAVATWVYAYWHSEDDTTDIDNIDTLDGQYASLGEHIPPAYPVLGWVLLDLGFGNEMGSSQNFVVFATTPAAEDYDVWVSETTDIEYRRYVGQGTDDQNRTFQTPSSGAGSWRYILIIGVYGVGGFGGDYAYGPDIDAVGWDKP